MTEPTRFTTSRGMKATLLASARPDRPQETSYRKALVAASAAVAASAQASSATAGVSLLARLVTSKWIIVGAVGLGAVMTARTVLIPSLAPAVARVAAPSPPPPRDPPRTSAPAVVATSAWVPAAASSVPRHPTPAEAPSRSREAPVPRPPISKLAGEIAALDRAKQALTSGDAPEALRQVDAYRGAFPAGTLFAEATALRIEALARLGREGEARTELARLKRQSPESPLLDSLTRTLEAQP
jgi:hypothetical protein